ncbi:MAG: N-acetylglucosamine-6-phosphate deacetylase [Opitutae bacterium]|jgi:N-acetylglucosamine-6-phosphate deacetylase|nr:N-acetylglucosamine-6-phosphate deacetylase [Opitutae bacterium]
MNDARLAPDATTEPRGFFDLQVNGFGGVDFQRDELTAAELGVAVKRLRQFRTSRILLTLITDDVERMCRKLERIERWCRADPTVAETIVGYHLEGPWLRPEPGFCGAHDPRRMCDPTVRDLERLLAAGGGRVRLVTLAPELPGATETIAHAVQRGVRVSAGHTDADDRDIDRAIAAGLSLCTHVGNGVPAQLHRHDNIIQRLLARDELTAIFIPDGIHVPRAVLKNFVRAKPRDKVWFTTDCMAAAGAGPGRYTLGALTTEVGADGIVRQPGQASAFAGSSLTMDAAYRNVREFLGWSEAEAMAACSTRVAEALGL